MISSRVKAPFSAPAHIDVPRRANPQVLTIAAQLRSLRLPGNNDCISLLAVPATPGMSAALFAAELATALPQLNEAPVLVVDLGLPGHSPLLLEAASDEVQISRELAVAEPAWADEICNGAAGSSLVYSRLKSDHTSILTSPEFTFFMSRARRSFRYIIFQGPAPQVSVESVLAAYYVDGVLLTVGAQATSVAEAREAQKLLSRTGARLLGFVYDHNPPVARKGP